MEKVFGIGINKTGSKSIAKAMTILGFNSLNNANECRRLTAALRQGEFPEDLSQYDFFVDFPSPPVPELINRLPNAKFILTTRDRDEWLQSRVIHVLHNIVTKSSSWQTIDTDHWLNYYDEYHQMVRNYFKSNSNFLELDIFAGEGWEKLCAFLGQPIPDINFPKVDTSRGKLSNILQQI